MQIISSYYSCKEKRIFIWQVSDEVEQSRQIWAELVTDGWKENQDPKLSGFLLNLHTNVLAEVSVRSKALLNVR